MNDYDEHNISFGAIDIDSGWSTGYNNFEVDTSKFPSFPSLVSSIHQQGRRIILWATSMVDTDCSTFNYSLQNDYFVKDGFNKSAIVTWWHGSGGFLDYFNPSALNYWQSLMNNVISIPSLDNEGIDGWKVDGSDAYIIELLTPISYEGPITYRDYADQYYRNFLYYTRKYNNESLIWSRPVDSLSNLPLNLSIFLPYSPKDVMFSGWVGDQDPTFEGLRAAAINVLESAWENYTNFGTDTGGYRGGNRTREVFLRWSQLNSFLPLFENGGDNEHRPWAFDGVFPGDTTASDLYRRLVNIHYELVPYLYTTGCTQYSQNLSSLTPLSSPPNDFPFPVQPDDITDWSYRLGLTMYISPIVYENLTTINVTLPSTMNNSPGWYDYYNPKNTYPSGTQLIYPTSLDPSLPFTDMTNAVFVQQSSMLPLHVSTSHGLVPYGNSAWSAALTIVVQNQKFIAPSSSTVPDTLFVQNFGTPSTITIGTELSFNCFDTIYSCHLEATAFNRPLIFLFRWTDSRSDESFLGTNKRVPQRIILTSLIHSNSSLSLLSDDIFYSSIETNKAALAWDTTAIDGGKYPLGDNTHTTVHTIFETHYGNHYYYIPSSVSSLGIHELFIFISRQDMETGMDIDIQF